MKRYLLFALIASTIGISSANAQEEELSGKTGFDKNKLFFGGNFGLSFGDYTIVNVSPQLGYRFNNYLAAGAGINLLYSSTKLRD